MARSAPSDRSRHRSFLRVRPRWSEIDIFGHVNNAEFYSWFDTAVLTFLHEAGAVGRDLESPATLVVESCARFHAEILFTDAVDVGLLVERLGTSSVTYSLGVFLEGRDAAAVDGSFTHVFADRMTRRPTAIPKAVRQAFRSITAEAEVPS